MRIYTILQADWTTMTNSTAEPGIFWISRHWAVFSRFWRRSGVYIPRQCCAETSKPRNQRSTTHRSLCSVAVRKQILAWSRIVYEYDQAVSISSIWAEKIHRGWKSWIIFMVMFWSPFSPPIHSSFVLFVLLKSFHNLRLHIFSISRPARLSWLFMSPQPEPVLLGIRWVSIFWKRWAIYT